MVSQVHATRLDDFRDNFDIIRSKPKVKKKKEVSKKAPEQTVDEVSVDRPACDEDQTSFPLRIFSKLFADGEVNFSNNSDLGILKIFGNMKVANCRSMISYSFSRPKEKEGRPYVFQISIVRPSSCKGDKCDYQVDMGDDGVKVGTKKISVEPNLNGFIQCLKETGVYTDNGVDESKLVSGKFKKEYSTTKTGELWMYSWGKEGPRSPLYSDESLKDEHQCRFYEHVADGGFKIYSKYDEEQNALRRDFQALCNEKDFHKIKSQSPKYQGTTLWNEYQQILKESAITEMEKVKKLISKHSKGKRGKKKKNVPGDLSGLEDKAAAINDILQTYKKLVIQPLVQKIANQVQIVQDLENDGVSKSIIAEAQKLLDGYIEEYFKLMKIGVGEKEYKAMTNFKLKAPLHNDDWREAAKSVGEISETVLNLARYHSKIEKKYPKIAKRIDNLEEYLTPEETLDLIGAKLEVREQRLSDLGMLANDPSYSIAKQHTESAQSLVQNHVSDIYALKEDLQYEQMYARQECMNPRKFWVVQNPALQRNCMMNSQAVMQDIQYDLALFQSPEYMSQVLQPQVRQQQQLASEWSAIEAARNQAYGYTPESTTWANNLNVHPSITNNPAYAQRFQEEYLRRQMLQAGNNPNNVWQQRALQEQMMQRQLMLSGRNPAGVNNFNRAPSWMAPSWNAQYQFQLGA